MPVLENEIDELTSRIRMVEFMLINNRASPGMPLLGTNVQYQRALRNGGEAEMSCVRPNRRE